MSVMYHPLARTINQRGNSGCLTPNNQIEAEANSPTIRKQDNFYKPSSSNTTTSSASGGSTILSPPLSPYQRNSTTTNDSIEENNTAQGGALTKNYVLSSSPFKIENYKKYELKVNAWNGLDSNYKAKQFKFLEQYSIISAKEKSQPQPNRRITNRKREFNSDSDSEFTNTERVRTRRIAKESSVAGSGVSDIESSRNSSQSPSPRKKKARKEASYTGSPLAIQQASFIDENIPDYSPDVSTLPKGNNRSLKVEWKGQPMDLRNDPNADKIHPAEVLLASTLRLPCNVYLDSKRRLFYEKVNRMKSGMQFRRTDAQKACRIDVNKASRLFAAFEKVGWLNDVHFTKYL